MNRAATFIAAAIAPLVVATSSLAAVNIGAAGLRDLASANSAIENVQFVVGGQSYCWYDGGWRGPGWYYCGYAWRTGLGWGGVAGWNSWVWRGGGRYWNGGRYYAGGWRGGVHGGGAVWRGGAHGGGAVWRGGAHGGGAVWRGGGHGGGAVWRGGGGGGRRRR